MSLHNGLRPFADLLKPAGRCTVTALKRDGRPQLSAVDYCWNGETLRFSTVRDSAKVRNLRRDPRISIAVTSQDGSSYAVFEGDAELGPVAVAADDAATEELVEVFRAVQGEHPDWNEYRAAMVADHRCVVRLRPTRAYGYLRPTTPPAPQ